MEAAEVLAAVAALFLGVSALLYYYLAVTPWCRNTVSLRGKTVLITGGNAGIGKATAVDLARRGARVILACRNKARGESAVYDIRRESGNSEVILMILDLSSLNSVRAFAQNFLESEPRLDILINNAGVFEPGQTTDGFDQVFQVNHLAHFLLTHLLLDRLKRCAPSRIVILSSSAHSIGKMDFRTIHKPVVGMWKALYSYGNSKLANLLHARELASRLEGTNVTCYVVHPGVLQAAETTDGYDQGFQVNHLAHFLLTHLLLDRLKRCAPSRIIILSSSGHATGKINFRTIHKLTEKARQGYDNSKLANILHVRELAKQLEGTNVTCYAVHPGVVKTEIARFYPWWSQGLIWSLQLFIRSCKAGAQTSIYCATEEGIERLSGRYFADCQPKVPSLPACDDQLAKKLWEFSERLLGLTS